MIGILEFIAISLLLIGFLMFTSESKKSHVYRWLLLTISMALCVFCSVLNGNGVGILVGLIAFVLDFKLFIKSLRVYNKENNYNQSKGDEFLRELNRYYDEKKHGIRKLWQ